MLATLMVAIVTVGLLLTGALIVGNSQQPSDASPADAEYSEDFFGSLDSLVGGLEQNGIRGSTEQTREDKYQLYLQAKERASAEPKSNLFLNVGKQPTQVQTQANTSSQPPATVPGTTTGAQAGTTGQTEPVVPSLDSGLSGLDEDLLDFSEFDINLDDFDF